MLTKLGLLLLGTTLFVSVAVASDRPDWTERAMFTWGEETYFVGVASCAKSAEEGRDLAHAAAMRELRHYDWPLGTRFTTERVFEERPGEGCAADRVTVWRLLKHDALAKPIQRVRKTLPFAIPETVTVEGLHPVPVRCTHTWKYWFTYYWTQSAFEKRLDDELEETGLCRGEAGTVTADTVTVEGLYPNGSRLSAWSLARDSWTDEETKIVESRPLLCSQVEKPWRYPACHKKE